MNNEEEIVSKEKETVVLQAPVSIVIPAYNEEENIEKIRQEINKVSAKTGLSIKNDVFMKIVKKIEK